MIHAKISWKKLIEKVGVKIENVNWWNPIASFLFRNLKICLPLKKLSLIIYDRKRYMMRLCILWIAVNNWGIFVAFKNKK